MNVNQNSFKPCTPFYWSPEALNGAFNPFSKDAFAIGKTLVQMIARAMGHLLVLNLKKLEALALKLMAEEQLRITAQEAVEAAAHLNPKRLFSTAI